MRSLQEILKQNFLHYIKYNIKVYKSLYLPYFHALSLLNKIKRKNLLEQTNLFEILTHIFVIIYRKRYAL